MALILIVDDQAEACRPLALLLRHMGHQGVCVNSGEGALAYVRERQPDLMILDVMMPGEDGLSIARSLAGRRDIGIVMVSALGSETDRIIGLEVGADDYLAKPVSPRELLARIRAVLRRANGEPGTAKEPPAKAIRFSGWTLEPTRRRLLNPDGAEVPLTGGEYELLQVLVERPNRVLTRDMLMDLLRGRQAGPFDRAIDVAVSRLRRKLEDDGRNPSLIKTVRGGGYVLAATVEKG